MSQNITPHQFQNQSDNNSFVLWLTGLSGSGKSTLADSLAAEINSPVFILDGDVLRSGLNSDLGFSQDDRKENLRRAAEVAKILSQAGVAVLASFISPLKSQRQMVRDIVGASFVECYVDVDLDICEQRDPKGLYKKARAGEIKNFTGVDSKYEPPEHPEITVKNGPGKQKECAAQIYNYLLARFSLTHNFSILSD